MTRPIRPLRPWLSRGRPVLAGSAIAMMAALAAQAAPAAPAVGAPPAARAGAPATLDAAPEARPIVLAAAQATTAAAAPVTAASLEAEADRAAAAAKRAAEASRDAARAAAEAEDAANEAAAAADAMRDAVAAGRTVTAPAAAPTPAPAAVAAEDPTDPAVIARYASAPGFKLGEAEIGRWTERPVTADDGAKGAVAQVNARGEGRFAVVCMPGDRGAVAYRAPLKMREALLAEGDRLTVDFIFDGKDTISRQLAWNEAGRYWTGPFAPESALAERMKKAMAVTIDVKGFDGVASEFSLDNSWRSIEAMFNDC